MGAFPESPSLVTTGGKRDESYSRSGNKNLSVETLQKMLLKYINSIRSVIFYQLDTTSMSKISEDNFFLSVFCQFTTIEHLT